jgi:two-component system CheB/CheR fusion protein
MSTTNPADDPKQSPADPPDAPAPESPHFPVVGVGASAGGLEAFTELLEHLPTSPGVALLFVLHIDPHHKSHLTDILARVTSLPVHEATEGVKVEPDHVYIIPPNANMALTDGALSLTSRQGRRGLNMPADHLFRSLAAIQKSRAIGIILSGSGTDGTLGFQAIKAEGGITFAQDEKSAKYASMPGSAILDGCVDYVLTPRQIGQELARLSRHPYTRVPPGPATEPHVTDAPVSATGEPTGDVLNLLRASTGVDFTHYKRSTIKRRILRRMALRGIERFEEYLHLLHGDAGEVHSLYQDFLIRVTQFFRDTDAFEALRDKVFPVIVQGRSPGSPVLVWVAGCSTGEEVYSLAIALLEFLENRPETPGIKILATDLNEAALEKARAGVYLDNIEIDVSPERLRRYFVRINGHYQISKSVRDLCVFSRHNMATDPPFSHLDLVSCRNVLIYLDGPLQRRILPILHYALNPGGFLLLGGSESIGPWTELFAPVDAKHRIYGKKPASSTPPLDFHSSRLTPEGPGRLPGQKESGAMWSALDVQKEADRIILSRYAPVGVVIDDAMTVLQFRGRTAPYLEPAPGMASLDLLRMLREGLLADVRSAINQAKSENTVATRTVRRIDSDQSRQVQVEVIPFKIPPSGVRFFQVLFRDLAPANEGVAPAVPPERLVATDQQVAQLQQELAALREYLQSVIEEQESTNEELKSANEEILSANEELQSTNEELQTAKEEAQSANEELATVNEELRHRNAELARVNNDLINVLSGVNIPIVLVGRDLRIRRFTPQTEQLFNLIPTDVGRPISDIQSNLNVADLAQLITAVIDTLTPYEGTIQAKGGHWYSLRVRPYVTMEGKIDGASIVLVDIDSLKKSLEAQTPPASGT